MDATRSRRDWMTESVPLRFLVVGGANTAVGLAVIYSMKWAGISDVPANGIGYAAGLALSFTLNRRWTFRHVGRSAPALGKFLLVFGIAYALNLATVTHAIDVLHVNPWLAQALGILPYTAFMYLASRHFAFRDATRPASALDEPH